MKFGRKYQLTIETDGQPVIIKPPFTIRFNVSRHISSSMNMLDIEIYNLNEGTRDKIFRDRFYNYNAPIVRRKVTFEAGYDTLSTVFKGTVFESGSYRDGVDIITSINSRDGGFEIENDFIYQTINTSKGYPTQYDIFNILASHFGTLSVGAISNLFKADVIQRPVVLNGNTYDLLKKYSDNRVYVDLEKIYIIKDNETIAGAIPLISAETGLLSTPRRDDSFIQVTTLFEPRIVMGQVINLISSVQPKYNSKYKVVGVQHQGIISDSVNGDCRSIISLYDPTKLGGALASVN